MNVIDKIKSVIGSILLWLIKTYRFIFLLIKIIISFLNKLIITLILITTLIVLKKSNIIITDQLMIPLFIGIGSTLITILILTYSISIIAIQRAVDSFSKTISFLFRTDKLTNAVFIIISIVALLSYMSAIKTDLFGISFQTVLFMNIILVGMILDLIRWYFQHACKLLEPDYALLKLSKAVKTRILRVSKRINRFSKVAHFLLPKSQKKEYKLEEIEGLFNFSAKHHNYLNTKLSELEEIAIKSLMKNDTNTFSITVGVIGEIINEFIFARKENLVFSPSEVIGVSQSDADPVMNKSYEILSTLSQRSHREGNQNSSIQCIRQLCKIGININRHLVTDKKLSSRDFLYSPIYHCLEIMDEAQLKGLDEVLLSGLYEIEKVMLSFYKKHADMIVDMSLNEKSMTFVSRYILKNNHAYGNKVLEYLMKRLFALIPNKPYKAEDLLRDIIKNLEQIIFISLKSENFSNSNKMYFHLSTPYSITSKFCFFRFVEQTQQTIQVDEERSHVSPYLNFSKINKVIAMHFRKLADNYDLGMSNYHWHIGQSIKYIIQIQFHHLSNPLTEVTNYIGELIENVYRYLAFFWSSTMRAQQISKYNADEACEVVCWVGLHCFQYDSGSIAFIEINKMKKNIISSILQIIDDYLKKGEKKSPYDIADLIVYLLKLRIVAINRNEADLVREIDDGINKLKIKDLDNAEDYIKAIELRFKQLIERLFDERRGYDIEDNSDKKLRGLLTDRTIFEKHNIKEIFSKDTNGLT